MHFMKANSMIRWKIFKEVAKELLQCLMKQEHEELNEEKHAI